MAKDKITDYSATNASNTDVGGIGILGSNTISNFDNAVREVMTHLAEVNAGTYPLADTFSVGDPADLTKKVRIDAGNVTAGQTRVLSMPDQNVTITADAADLLAQVLSSTQKNKVVKANNAGTAYVFQRNPFYDPYEYGATGDGSTDDTTALAATQTAANANDGIQASPKGRGVVVLPPGSFKTTGLTAQNSREYWMGLGGTLTAVAANQVVMTVAYDACVLENLILTQAFKPTSAAAVLKQTAGGDCTFRKLLITGGYYGIECTGGGDCVWIDNKVTGSYADFVYLHGYSGFWSIRNKFDGDWPAPSSGSKPTSAQIKGAWAINTLYAAGDVVTANGYYHQCSTGGTSLGSGSGPTVTLKGSTFDDNGTLWKTHRTTLGSGIKIESDSFINFFWLTDITGGHIYSTYLLHTLGSAAPQTVKFLDACEFGSPLTYGMIASAADDVEVSRCIIDNVINTSAGTGIITATTTNMDIHHNLIRQTWRGVSIGPSSVASAVDFNTFSGITGWCVEFQAAAVGFQAIGNKCGTGVWGANANGIRVRAGASDEYIVSHNRGRGITGTRWTDGGTGFVKVFGSNV